MLSATQVARFCGVDLKTIHNWANKGKIPGTRTAGRHLRFRPLDVVDFLRAYEFGIPEALRSLRLRVLVVDADVETLATARRVLGRRFDVTTAAHVIDGLLAISAHPPDVVVAGDVAPLDAVTLARRLATLPPTRHVRGRPPRRRLPPARDPRTHDGVDLSQRPSRYAFTPLAMESATSWRYSSLPRRCSSVALEM
jgi:excisionase family DNA binding protein